MRYVIIIALRIQYLFDFLKGYKVMSEGLAATNKNNHEQGRRRKLLLHKEEISRIFGKIQQRGYNLVPLKVYFKRGIAKVEIGIAKGKKLYDKREDIKKRDAGRGVAQAFRERQKQQ